MERNPQSDENITLTPFPAPMRWYHNPRSWQLSDGPTLLADAGPQTDLFASPQGDAPTLNAPRLLGPISGDFQLGARVRVDFGSTFDAGALLVWRDEQTWGKLCFEFSPLQQPMVVSVVTRGTSDDANGFTADERSIWLRISRIGPAFAFHASRDGRRWDLIRHLALDAGEAPLVGMVAQSPTGPGCSVRFTDIRYVAATLADIRSGE